MMLFQRLKLIFFVFITACQYAFSTIDSISSEFEEGATISNFSIFTDKLKQKTINNILSKDVNIVLADISSSMFSEEQLRAINYFNGLKQFESFYKNIPKLKYYKGFSNQTKRRFNLMCHEMVLKMKYNEDIQKMIDHILHDKKKFLRESFALKDYYFPLIESFLDKYNIPLELKYLSVIESSLNPLAHSHAGAKGIWQFIYSTGNSLGLKVTSYIDDRANPVKSTKAACIYLKKLYNIFRDWNLAIAAYNCGMGNLKKAISRAKGSKDFWEVKPFLPKETQNYVISFYTIAYIFNNHSFEYSSLNKDTILRSFFDTDTISIEGPMYLKDVANLLNIDISELRFLNPQYIRDIIPKSDTKSNYSIRVPISKLGILTSNKVFVEYYGQLSFNYKWEKKIPIKKSISLYKKEKAKQSYYTVKKGDVLIKIAKKLDVTVNVLKERNGLRSDKIKPGMILRF